LIRPALGSKVGFWRASLVLVMRVSQLPVVEKGDPAGGIGSVYMLVGERWQREEDFVSRALLHGSSRLFLSRRLSLTGCAGVV
jgi:hypothetical protein